MEERTIASGYPAGKIHVFRNTFPRKAAAAEATVLNSKGGTIGTVAYNFFIGTAYNGQKASNKGQGIGAPQTQYPDVQ